MWIGCRATEHQPRPQGLLTRGWFRSRTETLPSERAPVVLLSDSETTWSSPPPGQEPEGPQTYLLTRTINPGDTLQAQLLGSCCGRFWPFSFQSHSCGVGAPLKLQRAWSRSKCTLTPQTDNKSPSRKGRAGRSLLGPSSPLVGIYGRLAP